MKNLETVTTRFAAALLVLCVIAAVFGCNRGAADDEIETLVITDEHGETKVSYKVVVTAVDESGSEYVVTEYYVDDIEEAVEKNSKTAKAAKTSKGDKTAADSPAKTVAGTTAPGAGASNGGVIPGTTASHGGASGTKTTTPADSASKTAASNTVTSKTDAPAKETTTKKETTTTSTTAYVPVSEISASFTFLDATDKAAYFASSGTLADFGLPIDAERSLKSDPSGWSTYTIAVDFKNTTGSNLTVYGLKLAENGTKSVYVAPNSAGEMGFPANDKSDRRIFFNVLVGNNSLSESAVISIIKGMGASLVYSRTPGNDNDAVVKQYSDIK